MKSVLFGGIKDDSLRCVPGGAISHACSVFPAVHLFCISYDGVISGGLG